MYLAAGKSYLIYGVKKDDETFVYYCGLDRHFNQATEFILNKLKKHVRNIKVDTRWGRTTYIPRELYLSYNPDSTKHLSLIKVNLNTENGSIGIKHLTADSKALKKRMKTIITKEINWEAKLSKTHYPLAKYTFILEIYPYTSSKELREKLKAN